MLFTAKIFNGAFSEFKKQGSVMGRGRELINAIVSSIDLGELNVSDADEQLWLEELVPLSSVQLMTMTIIKVRTRKDPQIFRIEVA